ncbi:MAG: pilus assembly protein [Reyranella sp.]|jgi:Flp pilus assembly protein TadG|nr:pilus assembly protein [Reyranella sp.]
MHFLRQWRPPRVATDHAGNIMIEFALALPVLALLVAGLVDLGSFGLQKSAMLQGARAGAQFGTVDYSSTSNISATARSATGLSGVTATSSVFCECVSGTAVSCSTTCSSGQTLKRYVTVSTTKPFTSALSVVSHNFDGFVWTPPTTVSASITMIIP